MNVVFWNSQVELACTGQYTSGSLISYISSNDDVWNDNETPFSAERNFYLK
jgi:hypothetical protein